MHSSPDSPLRCLLIQPRFAATNYWNFTALAEAIGAKATAPPLGLLTVAALLPAPWKLELIDLNVRDLDEGAWNRADVICVGGMLPQQPGILEIVDRARRDGKYVVVGGPDPTSQPQIYNRADALVLGEGEASIPIWLDSWRRGEPRGTFQSPDRPAMSLSPVPRFDLVSFDDYLHVGVQSSRGCPYNCEFCDIIELYGRRPRVKAPEQFVAEMESLYQLGYRGWIDIADDNFIGNRLLIKPLLLELERWNKSRGYPFIFSTEASVNLADDEELLDLMRRNQFRYVFVGIESPDAETLVLTQKPINAMRPLIERIRKIYSYGISISAGFILGFDSEQPGTDREMSDFIQESGIVLAMVGLLSALPNTQLGRRLARERRLISTDHVWLDEPTEPYELRIDTEVDQTMGGLNFVTARDRVEVYREMRRIITAVYSERAFMDRVLDTTRRLQIQNRHVPNWWELQRMTRGFLQIAWSLLRSRRTRWLYLRNAWQTLRLGFTKFEFAHSLMGTYLHFDRQTRRITEQLDISIEFTENQATYPRSTAEIPLDVTGKS